MKVKLCDEKPAKSYHIFCWPFQFEKRYLDSKKPFEEFGWVKKNLKIRDNEQIKYADTILNEEFRNKFMLEKYLSDSAKDIFINSNDICTIYEYPNIDPNSYKYTIEYLKEKMDQSEEKVSYILDLVSIELHIYMQGVGILFFNTKNTGCTDIDDIKIINDVGRRLDLAYIPMRGWVKGRMDSKLYKADYRSARKLCASKIEIKNTITNKKLAELNFEELLNQNFDKNSEKEIQLDISKLSSVFCEQIIYQKSILKIKKRKKRKIGSKSFKNIGIKAYTDDRMYLISLIQDEGLSQKLKKLNLTQKSNFKGWNSKYQKEEFLELLYSIIFCDKTDATCQNPIMREELLASAIDYRWSGYGTIHAVTNYSTICITGESMKDVGESVVRPFLVEYVYMISLVYAQSMLLNTFSKKASVIAKKMTINFCFFRNYKRRKEIMKLQRDYVQFKNEIMILRYSWQDQGIEIYDLLQKQLLVQKEQEKFDVVMGNLYEIGHMDTGITLSWIAIIVAFITFIVTCITLLVG